MSNEPTVEELRRLRAAALGNPGADAVYVAAFNRAPQSVKEALLNERTR